MPPNPQQDKRVTQTYSDVLDVLLTADNNGWNLKAVPFEEKEQVCQLKPSLCCVHAQVKLKLKTKHTYFVIIYSSLIIITLAGYIHM